MTMISNDKEKYKKKRGFTLVELLAVVAILAVVVTVVVVVATNVINNTKEKSYKVTIGNVEKAANSYVREYQSDMFWIGVEGDDNQVYQCISVQNLIDTGYFKGNLLESEVSKDRTVNENDNIYVVMDNDTKNIVKTVLLYDEESTSSGLCEQTDLDAYIDFDVPGGWAREKEVLITYRLSNRVGVTDGYKYSYYQDNDESVLKEQTEFTNLIHIEKVIVSKNGYLNALVLDKNGSTRVTRNYKIEGIDREGPVIDANYDGDNVVSGSITIPISVTDVGSGVEKESFTLSDLVISIGGNVITEGITLDKVDDNNYNLKIENYEYNGEVKITIDEDNVFDMLDNGNDMTELMLGVSFANTYKITYKANGGSGAPSATTYTYATSGTTNLSSTIPTRTGYKFLGWSTDKNATSASYSAGQSWKLSNAKNYTLYAVWKKNSTSSSSGSSSSGSSSSSCVSGYYPVGEYCCPKGETDPHIGSKACYRR